MSFPLIGRIFRNKTKELLDKIDDRLQSIEETQDAIIDQLGNCAVHCDRCNATDAHCLKCMGTGVIKRKQLFSWPFK